MADRPRLDKRQTLLDKITQAPELSGAAGFNQRCDAIDLLELHLSEPSGSAPADQSEGASSLRDRAIALCHRLERKNALVIQGLRQDIEAGRLLRGDLVRELERYCSGPAHGTDGNVEYDHLDTLVAGILETDRLLDDQLAETLPEMIPYQPTPARVVLEIVKRTDLRPHDVFVDVGSGLGVVPTLVSLLSGATSIGIEVQVSYCRHAEERVQRLGLSNVRFVCQDARDADLSVGTVFYMYAPFKGAMLRRVLERLQAEGRRRRFRLCVYGPLMAEALRQPWLTAFQRSDLMTGPVTVFDSRPA